MVQSLLRWLFLTVAVVVATAIVPGIDYTSTMSLLVASLVLAVLNTFLRPLLILISLPLVVFSLGIFLLVLNALLLMLTSKLVPGFIVDGFWSALFGSLIISMVSFFLGMTGRPPRPQGPSRRSEPPRKQGPPPGEGPVIDI
jgi:putative membrane protein